MLWSSSSSIHRGGTSVPRAATRRSWSSGTSPSATAAANRTSAAVAGSSGPAAPARATPWLILRLPRAASSILLLLQPPIYAQRADGLAARIQHGSGGERLRSRPQPELFQHGRQRERRRHGMPVGDLDGHPPSPARQHRAVHALGADLDDHPTGLRPHHLRAGTAFAGAAVGMAEHGFDNAERG